MRRREPIAVDEARHPHERFAAAASRDLERDEELALANPRLAREDRAGT